MKYAQHEQTTSELTRQQNRRDFPDCVPLFEAHVRAFGKPLSWCFVQDGKRLASRNYQGDL